MSKTSKTTFPIDMVYLWCDGQELEFQKRKEKYLKECKKNYCNLSAGDIRFFDNDELKGSVKYFV